MSVKAKMSDDKVLKSIALIIALTACNLPEPETA